MPLLKLSNSSRAKAKPVQIWGYLVTQDGQKVEKSAGIGFNEIFEDIKFIQSKTTPSSCCLGQANKVDGWSSGSSYYVFGAFYKRHCILKGLEDY